MTTTHESAAGLKSKTREARGRQSNEGAKENKGKQEEEGEGESQKENNVFVKC